MPDPVRPAPDGGDLRLDFLQPADKPDQMGKLAQFDIIRVLGRGGSTSRMIRRTSSNAAACNRVLSNGVVPVKSS